jgi:hypothetical protein
MLHTCKGRGRRTAPPAALTAGAAALLLFGALPVAATLSGCKGTDTTSAHKDGEKFPPSNPPADYVAEMNRRRAGAAAPGPANGAAVNSSKPAAAPPGPPAASK